ncbi:MAG: DNA-binding transcriptional ArsR family regulator [Cyclobacteriaceae bacterium]|jgi:DNA-binding transcriptional ArsR family regulator
MSMNLDKMQEAAQKASELMKLLGHPDRLMILCELKSGEQSVGQLTDKIGISQSLVSQHLARMRYADVVSTRRDAQVVYYTLKEGPAAIMIDTTYNIFCKDDAD